MLEVASTSRLGIALREVTTLCRSRDGSGSMLLHDLPCQFLGGMASERSASVRSAVEIDQMNDTRSRIVRTSSPGSGLGLIGSICTEEECINGAEGRVSLGTARLCTTS